MIEEASQMTARKSRTRSCVGCQKAAPPSELVRFVLGPDGSLSPDLAGGAFGRGAWVHASSRCLRSAVPRGFARALRAEVRATPAGVAHALGVSANRRVVALLRAALGAKKLCLGGTAVDTELRAGGVALTLIATDARAAAASREVAQAIASGRAAAWGTKSELGLVTGRTETAIAGVLDAGLARAIQRTIELSLVRIDGGDSPEPSPSGRNSRED